MSTIEQRLNFYVANEFGINNLDLVEMNAETLVVVVRKCAQKSYQDLKRRVRQLNLKIWIKPNRRTLAI